MVEALELVRHFPTPEGTIVRAVDGVSFTAEPGKVLGLLGANGAGKTTCMRMIATLTRPTSGTARVAGFDVVSEPNAVRRHLGFLSASSGLPPRHTVLEAVGLFADLYAVVDRRAALDRVVGLCGLEDFANRRVETLSTGQRQRTRIASALVHRPAVLVLDEPTSGLDLVSSERLLETIRVACDEGTTVVFSTHVLREVERISDTICIIDEGLVLRAGTPAELMAETGTDRVEDAFLAVVRR